MLILTHLIITIRQQTWIGDNFYILRCNLRKSISRWKNTGNLCSGLAWCLNYDKDFLFIIIYQRSELTSCLMDLNWYGFTFALYF
jgi:hypothetical protein